MTEKRNNRDPKGKKGSSDSERQGETGILPGMSSYAGILPGFEDTEDQILISRNDPLPIKNSELDRGKKLISKDEAFALAKASRANLSLVVGFPSGVSFCGDIDKYWWFLDEEPSSHRVGTSKYIGIHKETGEVVVQHWGE